MTRKKLFAITLLIVLIASSVLMLTNVNPTKADAVPYFYPKSTIIQMFMNLYNQYPGIAHYESVGKTYNGNNIWLFAIGNPNGGRILWDGDLHGWEDIGTIMEYYFAQWLLTSGDPEAQRIVQNNYVMFIPVVNYDSVYTRQNADFYYSRYGTDLNRNFPTGWTSSSSSDSYSYSGPWPGSESEVQAMRFVFQAYHPNYYVNVHYGGDPILESDHGNSGQISYVFNRINQLSNQFGWSFPYTTKQGNWDEGYAVADAASFGANAFLFEMGSNTSPIYTTGDCYWHTAHSLSDVQNYFFPKTLPVLIAMAEASGGWTTSSSYYFSNNLNTQPTPTPVASPAYKQDQSQPTTAIGIWHFDEASGNVAYDSSGNQNQGAIINAGWTTGKTGSGLWFNGVPGYNAYVSIPSSSSLAGFSTGFSAEAWIYFNAVNKRETILNKYSAQNGQMGWFVDYNANSLELFTSQDGSSYTQAATSFTPISHTWYHIAITWQPNQPPSFYINGQFNPVTYSTGVTGSIYNNAAVPLLIGKCPYDNTRSFDGAIDEVYLYNYAITQNQIADDAGLSGSMVFSDDFSTQTFGAWSGTSMYPNNQVIYVSSASTYHGTPLAVFTTLGSGNHETAYAYKNIGSQSQLYASGHIYVMTSGIAQENARFYFIRFLSGGNNGDPVAFAGWRMVNGIVKWELLLRNGNGWISAYSDNSPSTQQWYSIELHWLENNNNGGGDLYVNGQQVATIRGINTAALGNVDTVLYGTGEAVNTQHTAIYAGSFAISTEYIDP